MPEARPHRVLQHWVAAVTAGLCLTGYGAHASQGAAAGTACGVPKSYACAQAEDEELPDGETVLAKAMALFGGRYANIWWDRHWLKSAIDVATVRPTHTDQADTPRYGRNGLK